MSFNVCCVLVLCYHPVSANCIIREVRDWDRFHMGSSHNVAMEMTKMSSKVTQEICTRDCLKFHLGKLSKCPPSELSKFVCVEITFMCIADRDFTGDLRGGKNSQANYSLPESYNHGHSVK